MSLNNSRRSIMLQGLQNSARNISSEFSDLKRIPKTKELKLSPRLEQGLSQQPGFYITDHIKLRNLDEFVPLFPDRENHKTNQIISDSSRIDSKKSTQILEEPSSARSIKSTTKRNTRLTVDFSPLALKDRRQYLTELLAIDTTYTNDSASQSGGHSTDVSPYFAGESESKTCHCTFNSFKLNLPTSQKHLRHSRANSKESFSIQLTPKKLSKPHIAFMSKSPNKQRHLRTQSNFDYPSVGQYETKNIEFIKPRVKGIIISKTKLERTQPLIRTNSSFTIANQNLEKTEKSISDDSRTIKKGIKTVILETKKRKDSKEIKRIDELAEQYLSDKYKEPVKPLKITIIKGLDANKHLPHEAQKMQEMSGKLMKLYNLVKNNSESTGFIGKSKTNIHGQKIENAWSQYFA